MLLVLVLIGLNMRPLLTSVGPLLPQLRQASGMSFSVAALLTALPVVTMGGLALAGSWLHQHVSERRSVAISLLLIAVGALMRELYPQSVLLLSSALLGGVGIGIIQAVMPSVIKRRFQQRTPQVMGLWSAALMGGGGLGAAITPWLVQHSESWYQTLAWWVLLVRCWRSLPCGGKVPRGRPFPQDNAHSGFACHSLPAHGRWVFIFGVINGGYARLIAGC
ncbi:cyanate transporter [Escherichia coli]